MVTIVCPYCFRDFEPADMWFRCLEHDPPFDFEWWEGKLRKPPTYAACTKGEHLCGIRLCPKCKRVLPYHIGRGEQMTIAVTGPRAAGKTLYLWSLLHELRGRLATDPEPFAAAMFEDDQSFDIYAGIARTIFIDGEKPGATQVKQQEQGNLPPTTVRLWCGDRLITLSLYDPAGELVENLQKIGFLSYLRHSAAIIYLVPPPSKNDIQEDQQATLEAGDAGLAAVARHLRSELDLLGKSKKIPKMLAVVVTKSDIDLFKNHTPEEITPGYRWSQADWRSYGRREREEIRQVSEHCGDVIRELGYDNLVNNATQEFEECRFFAVSNFGEDPDRNGAFDPKVIRPIGVECPLFWCLKEARSS